MLGTGAVLCALLNSPAPALPSILDTAINPADNHTYYLLDNSNWTDAANKAIQLGGNLVTINNLAENNLIWNLWGTNRDLWIGLYDPIVGDGNGAQHANDFRWVSADPSTYRNWRSGEPNNAVGDYYAYILAKGLVAEGGAWNDVANIVKNGSEPAFYGVVEIVPEPSSGLLLASGLFSVFCAKRMCRSRRN